MTPSCTSALGAVQCLSLPGRTRRRTLLAWRSAAPSKSPRPSAPPPPLPTVPRTRPLPYRGVRDRESLYTHDRRVAAPADPALSGVARGTGRPEARALDAASHRRAYPPCPARGVPSACSVRSALCASPRDVVTSVVSSRSLSASVDAASSTRGLHASLPAAPNGAPQIFNGPSVTAPARSPPPPTHPSY